MTTNRGIAWSTLADRLAVTLLALLAAAAAPAQEVTDLTRVFDAYNAAALASDLPKMLARREQMEAAMEKAEDRDSLIASTQGQVPDSYQVIHVRWNEKQDSATLYLLSNFSEMPKIQRPKLRMEESVSFGKEDGIWKLRSTRLLGDADNVNRVTEVAYSMAEANTEAQGKVGGRVVKTEYKDDHTLVVLRFMGEEVAVFLPPKALLLESNTQLDMFEPWNVHQFSGYPHKTDKRRFFATGGRLAQD